MKVRGLYRWKARYACQCAVYERLRGLCACGVSGTKQYCTKARTNNDKKPRECKVKKNGKSITGTSSIRSHTASPTTRSLGPMVTVS
jgi:hypothetical protein